MEDKESRKDELRRFAAMVRETRDLKRQMALTELRIASKDAVIEVLSDEIRNLKQKLANQEDHGYGWYGEP